MSELKGAMIIGQSGGPSSVINASCYGAIKAGLDSAIMDPCNVDIMSTIYACEALTMKDKSGRKYNRAYRKGLIGKKKQ